jgi:hypothetical protein
LFLCLVIKHTGYPETEVNQFHFKTGFAEKSGFRPEGYNEAEDAVFTFGRGFAEPEPTGFHFNTGYPE